MTSSGWYPCHIRVTDRDTPDLLFGSWPTAPPLAPAGFCALAEEASYGHVALDTEEGAAALIEFPGLSEAQRNIVRRVVEDAARWIKLGNGWDTTELVIAVHQLCGVDLTPVTMIP